MIDDGLGLFIVLLLIGFGGVGVVSAVRGARSHLGIFRPTAIPLLYLCLVFLGPPMFMWATGSPIGSVQTSTITTATVSIAGLFLLGYVCGAVLFRRAPSIGDFLAHSWSDFESRTSRFVVTAGRFMLAASLAAKVYQVATTGSIADGAYGANQLDYSLGTTVAVVGEGLVAAGALLVMYGNTVSRGYPVRGLDTLLLGAILAISMFLLGSRGEAIAPIVMFAWFHVRSGRRVRILPALVVIVAVIAVFELVSNLRAAGPAVTPISPLENMLFQVSSPTLLSYNVSMLVPESSPFTQGSTYIASLGALLPGALTRAVFGDVSGTGALYYRELIHFDNPNQGWGFAYPTEAYLNFGFFGVFVMALLLGAFLSVAFRKAVTITPADRLWPVVYPLVISYIPYGIRSDALAQMKSVLYPLIMMGFVLIVARTYGRMKSPSISAESRRPRHFLGRR